MSLCLLIVLPEISEAVEPAESKIEEVDLQQGEEPARLVPAENGWALLKNLKFPRGERLPFEEIVQSRALKKPAAATGELWLDADGTLTLGVREPRVEERILAATELRLRRLKRGVSLAEAKESDWRVRRVSLERRRPALVLLRSIAQLLSGEVDKLEEDFELTRVELAATGWQLALRPRSTELADRLPLVELRGNETRLLSIHADRGAAGAQTVRLRATQPNS